VDGLGLVGGDAVGEAGHALVLAHAADDDVEEPGVGFFRQVTQILDPACGVLAVADGAVGGIEPLALGDLFRRLFGRRRRRRRRRVSLWSKATSRASSRCSVLMPPS
jgi:hypothetical protein